MLVPVPASPGVPLRAIVLDHDPEYADILRDVLSFVGEGPETWATTSAKAARQRITRNAYDVILVSLEAGGEHFLLDLRRFQPDAVILVSSDRPMTASQISKQFEAGADEVVIRPFHPSVLAARLNRLLLLRTGAQPAIALA